MGYTREQSRKARQPVLTGDSHISPVMTASGSQVIQLSDPSEKVTVQSSGTLTYTWQVSANGQTFTSPVSVAAGALSTYSSDVIAVVQLNWVSGTGQVTVLAV